LKNMCEEQGQYITPRLNNQLFLNGKGFSRIEALEEYTEVEALWLQSNSIAKIEGIAQMPYLKFLYLQSNLIETIENLQPFKYLVRLDLSGNRIHKIEGLSGLHKLQDLMLEDNLLSTAEDVRGVLDVQGSLRFLNVAKNRLRGLHELAPIFAGMDNLISVDLRQNPGVQEMPQYHKTFVASIRRLSYLDGNLIDELERLTAEAFMRGGRSEEQQVRQQYQQRKEEARKKEVEERKTHDVVVEARVRLTLEKYRQEDLDAWQAILARRLQLLNRSYVCGTDRPEEQETGQAADVPEAHRS
jgi:dynein assembly factor 1